MKVVDGDALTRVALDRLIHERVRWAIVSALAVHGSLTFDKIKALLDTSDGNVSVHARKLEGAGYILCTKGFDIREALEWYLSHMEALMKRVGSA